MNSASFYIDSLNKRGYKLIKVKKICLIILLIFAVISLEADADFFSWTMEKFIRDGKEISLTIDKTDNLTIIPQENITMTGMKEDMSIVLKKGNHYQIKPGEEVLIKLQVFASHEKKRVEDVYKKVKKQGFKDLEMVKEDKWYKLKVGPFNSRKEAEKTQQKLHEKGWESWPVNEIQTAPEKIAVYHKQDILFSAVQLSAEGLIKIEEKIYPGKFRFAKSNNNIKIINTVGLSKVVAGVTARKLENKDDYINTELLKAQAVSVRTNILYKLFNNISGILSIADYSGIANVTASIENAVNMTEGIILTSDKLEPAEKVKLDYGNDGLDVSEINYEKILNRANKDLKIVDLKTIKDKEVKIDAEIEWGFDFKEIHEFTWWGPRIITMLELDLSKDNFLIEPVLAENRVPGTEDLAQMVKNNRVLAGINGGYFRYSGRPLGLIIKNKEIVSEPLKNRTVIGFSEDDIFIDNIEWAGYFGSDKYQVSITGVNRKTAADEVVIFNHYYGEKAPVVKPGTYELVIKGGQIIALNTAGKQSEIPEDGYIIQAHGDAVKNLNRFRIGEEVQYKNRFRPDIIKMGIINAVGGGPRLVKDGEVYITSKQEKFQPDISSGRAPRTALGVTDDNKLIMITVDGRQPLLSIGISLKELAELMIDYGIVDGMNLDGGSSARMVVRGYTMNNPSQERYISNGILIKKKN